MLLFNIELCEPWTYQGHVQIHLEIESATKSIVLNTQELVLSTAEVVTTTLKNERSVLQATKISYDHRNQRCTLEFEQKLQPTHESTTVLHISFKGTVNNQLTGFYRSSYENLDESAGDEDEGEDDDDDDDESQDTRFMLSTQFQPTYARRAFPCFDEPGLKATFDFAVEVPVELVALSNMQVKGERPGKNRNFKVVEFERTPLMSTYLLAWAIGDFEYIERFATRSGAPSYPVRLYTTKGLAEHGKFGIEVAIKALDILSKVCYYYLIQSCETTDTHKLADVPHRVPFGKIRLTCSSWKRKSSLHHRSKCPVSSRWFFPSPRVPKHITHYPCLV